MISSAARALMVRILVISLETEDLLTVASYGWSSHDEWS